MTRKESRQFKKKRVIYIVGMYAMLFICATSVTFAIIINKENTKIKDFVLNYDKTKNVYNLQEDYKGGNF